MTSASAIAGVPSSRPLWLDVAPDPVFGTHHAPRPETAQRTAVLILPPWGWDEVTSYAARRAWAERLAADGHHALRIDLPGTGDSGGSPSDPDRVPAWTDAVSSAAAWLRSQPGVTRVAAIGLGIGGLVASRSIAQGAAIDDLVLWSAPVRGRSFLRELRAFAAMQSSRYSLTGEPEPELLPEGWLEVGGFVLSAETVADLGPLEVTDIPPGRVQRALLLERDGMGHDAALEAALVDRGVTVDAAKGDGWTAMVFHPERYAPPLDVFDRVGAWLADAPAGGAPALAQPTPTALDTVTLQLEGRSVQESAVRIDQPFGRLFGILGRPADAPATDLCAVFLNAGAVRRIGPNRLWVEGARRWNARGIPTIRMDLEGIGDADGDPRRYLDVGNYYTPEYGAEVGATLDELGRRGFGPRFVVIGLCAGGYWAFQTAADDRRIVEAIILNPRAMMWDPDLLTRREARKVERLLEPGLWNSIIHGEIPASRMLSVSRAVARRSAATAFGAVRRLGAGRRDTSTPGGTVETRLDALREHGTRTILAFSGDEPVYGELEDEGLFTQLGRWPNLSVERLPGVDHTVRPIAAQRAVHELLGREVERLLGAGPG